MKRFLLLFCLLAVLLTACNKWLDVQPRSQVEDTELFETESGYKETLAGVYSSMVSSTTYAKEMTYGFMGVLGQEWDFYYAAQYDDAAAYKYDAAFPTSTLRSIWSNSYSGIANVNNLLAHIDDNTSLFSKDNHGVIKGEAYALRAFLHFDLMRLFACAPAMDNNAPGVPYVTEYATDVVAQKPVGETMQLIVSDLLAAKDELVYDTLNF